MGNNKSLKKFRLIAAVCYGVSLIIAIIVYFSYLQPDDKFSIVQPIHWVILIGFTAALFLKNKKLLTVAVAANILLDLYYIIRFFSLFNVMYLVADAALLVLLILALKKSAAVKKIWFIAGAGMLIVLIGSFIEDVYGIAYMFSGWHYLLRDIIQIVGLFFAGLWLRGSAKRSKVTEPAAVDSRMPSSFSEPAYVIGGADKLLMYKDLLDKGLITYEEFDEKKHQILGF